MSKKNKKLPLKQTALKQNNDNRITLSNGSKSERLIFNFSFLSSKYDISIIEKNTYKRLLEKIVQLSQIESMTALLAMPKANGLEKMNKSSFKKDIGLPTNFTSSPRMDMVGDDYWVIRLSQQIRMIGKMTDTLFYVVAIDEKHEVYPG